jgi:DNA-binding response OmpR family regulator
MLRKAANRRKQSMPTLAAGGEKSREIFPTSGEKSPSPVVLVVERDRLLRWALYEMFVNAGFRVLTAPDRLAAEALLPIERTVALAIVDDATWPLTTSNCACLHHRWPGMPIIAMLENRDPALEHRARQHGAVAVIVKPFDVDELIVLARRLTQRPDAVVQTDVRGALAG